MKVKTLPKEVSNRIAAGEVVENPASVAKELLENAIDAGATEIKVVVKAGGIGELAAYDNGLGMSRKAIALVPVRFATNKIESEEDLQKVGSFGFRGEALSSITSVSKLYIASSQKDDAGHYAEFVGGEFGSGGEVMMDRGTVVKVRDLFFNVPVRRKFLKTKSGETRAIVDFVKRYAVAHPEIAFDLSVDGKTIFSLEKSELETRVNAVLNDQWLEDSVRIDGAGSGIFVSGIVPGVDAVGPGRPTQWLFVNKRPVEDPRIKFVVKEAYEAIAKRGRPGFVLFAEVPYADIDVNVHPRKTEVKFKNPSDFYRVVYMAVKKVFAAQRAKSFVKSSVPLVVKEPQLEYETKQKSMRLRQSKDSNGSVDDVLEENAGWAWNSAFLIIQIKNAYLVTQDKNGIVVVDQHAAAERVLYEEVLEAFGAGKIGSQGLVVPVDVDVDSTSLFDGWEKAFGRLGFSVELFGESKVRIRGIPIGVAPDEAKNLFIDLLQNIDEDSESGFEGKEKEVAASIACRHAIKFGDKLAPKDMEKLLSQLAKCKNPFSCPHGRPTMHRIPYNKLEVMFDRS